MGCVVYGLNSGEPLKQINPASQIPAATHSVLTPFFSAHEHTVMATHCEVTMVVPMRMVRVMMQIVMATRGGWLGECGTRKIRDGKRAVVRKGFGLNLLFIFWWQKLGIPSQGFLKRGRNLGICLFWD